MQIWEMTYNQYLNYTIDNSKYKNAIKSNPKQLEATKNSCLQKWVNALEERAEIGSIPEKVIRTYIIIFGEKQTRRIFRGVKAKGLEAWEQTQINKIDRLTIAEQYNICKNK